MVIFVDKVSVIVPVYNGEKYIERCIESILKQTYENVELIVINDGSTDNTKGMLDKYNDSIMVINKKNTGVSDSRNIGISKATGNYIMFCDADDWLCEEALEIAVDGIEKYDAIRFSHYIVSDNKKVKKENSDDVYSSVDLVIHDNKQLVMNLLLNKTEGHLWNYLLRTKIIKDNKLYFDDELFYQEDVVFLLEYFLKIKNLRVIDCPLYNYFKNSSSVTQNEVSVIRNLSSIWKIREKIIDLLKVNDSLDYRKIVEQRFLNLQLMYFMNFYIRFDKEKFINYVSYIASNNYDYYDELLRMNILSKKWRLFIKLLKLKKIVLFRIYIRVYMLLRQKLRFGGKLLGKEF